MLEGRVQICLASQRFNPQITRTHCTDPKLKRAEEKS